MHLDDLRVRKMILETAQILCAALWIRGIWQEGMYRPTHLRHPCVLWAEETPGAAWWLVQHAWELEEARRMAGAARAHASLAMAERAGQLLMLDCSEHATCEVARFANCTGMVLEEGACVHLLYRERMRSKWRDMRDPPTWRGREVPAWL